MSQSTDAYVRTHISPERAPPPGETGLWHWLRTRLFTSWYDTLGTAVILAALFWAVPKFLDWALLSAVFDANNVTECHAKGDGACWAMIQRRFGQIIYGFYDPESRWRINIGMVLLFLGIGFILFGSNRRRGIAARIMIFGYPFIAFDLFFGGFTLNSIPSSEFGGLFLTLFLASIGIVLSLPLGILLALGRGSKLPVLRWFCICFIEGIRAVPLITILFMAQFMLPFILPMGMDIDNLLRVTVGLVLFASAYMAEVIRGGLQAIHSGQYEAADTLGLNYVQKIRLVIMPQVLKMVLPGIVNLFIGIFKDTTLVSIIGLFDFLLIVVNSTQDSNWLGLEIEAYVFVALIFFIFCFAISRYSIHLEQKLKTEH